MKAERGFVKYLRSDFALGIFVFGTYVLAAQLGLMLATINKTASPVWPATGVALGFLFAFGNRFSFAVAAGALVANALSGLPLLAAVVIAIGNSLEAVVAATVLRRIVASKADGYGQKDAVGLAFAVGLGALVSASFGTSALMAFDLVGSPGPLASFVTWWVGDFLGGIILGPALIVLFQKNYFGVSPSKPSPTWMKVAAPLTLLVATVCLFLGVQDPKWLFIVFPPLLFTRQALGPRGVIFSVLLLSIVAIYCTFQGLGPFRAGTLNTNLINLQLFLAGVSITALVSLALSSESALSKAALVFCIGWSLSTLLVISFVERELSKDRERFEDLMDETVARILTRMVHYEDALRSGASLFRASKSVEWDEWRAFTESLNLRERYPGIHGIGTVSFVPTAQLREFERQMRLQQPGFRVHHLNPIDKSPRLSAHYVITFIEPKIQNESAQGLDLASEPNRREGAELARDSGLPAVTRRITLVQDNFRRPGFLLYLAYYKPNMALNSIEDRRKAFLGWIYAPFITEELFAETLASRSPEISFSIFDGDSTTAERIYPSSPQPRQSFQHVSHHTLGQRTFTIGWNRSAEFKSAHDSTVAWVAFAGAIFSLLMAGWIASLDETRARAQAIADRQTELLKHSQQKMIASSRLSSLGEMAAGIAHEINNPLAIISLDLEMIRKGMMEGADKIEARITHAERIVERISAIISNLRKIGREASHDPFASVAVQAVIADAVSLCHQRFRHHSIRLEYPQLDETIRIRARAVQISQVLVNLLSNAFDGVAGVDAPLVQIEVAEEGRFVKISVTDNGEGVPEPLREKIMEPFFTTKEVGKGTGLGLSISRSILDEHGGSLEYEPMSPGARFVLKIPKADARE